MNITIFAACVSISSCLHAVSPEERPAIRVPSGPYHRGIPTPRSYGSDLYAAVACDPSSIQQPFAREGTIEPLHDASSAAIGAGSAVVSSYLPYDSAEAAVPQAYFGSGGAGSSASAHAPAPVAAPVKPKVRKSLRFSDDVVDEKPSPVVEEVEISTILLSCTVPVSDAFYRMTSRGAAMDGFSRENKQHIAEALRQIEEPLALAYLNEINYSGRFHHFSEANKIIIAQSQACLGADADSISERIACTDDKMSKMGDFDRAKTTFEREIMEQFKRDMAINVEKEEQVLNRFIAKMAPDIARRFSALIAPGGAMSGFEMTSKLDIAGYICYEPSIGHPIMAAFDKGGKYHHFPEVLKVKIACYLSGNLEQISDYQFDRLLYRINNLNAHSSILGRISGLLFLLVHKQGYEAVDAFLYLRNLKSPYEICRDLESLYSEERAQAKIATKRRASKDKYATEAAVSFLEDNGRVKEELTGIVHDFAKLARREVASQHFPSAQTSFHSAAGGVSILKESSVDNYAAMISKGGTLFDAAAWFRGKMNDCSIVRGGVPEIADYTDYMRYKDDVDLYWSLQSHVAAFTEIYAGIRRLVFESEYYRPLSGLMYENRERRIEKLYELLRNGELQTYDTLQELSGLYGEERIAKLDELNKTKEINEFFRYIVGKYIPQKLNEIFADASR